MKPYIVKKLQTIEIPVRVKLTSDVNDKVVPTVAVDDRPVNETVPVSEAQELAPQTLLPQVAAIRRPSLRYLNDCVVCSLRWKFNCKSSSCYSFICTEINCQNSFVSVCFIIN